MRIVRLDSVNSTNTYAKEIVDEIKEDVVIIANKQTDGYGTNNRKWYSDENSIICSFLIKNKKKTIPLDYSFKIAVIVSKVINEICNVNSYIKEPNDVYLNNKKLGGILIETRYLSNKLDYVIIGIGLNINQESLQNEIKDIATSLSIETQKKYDKEEIISELIKKIESEE